MAVIQDLMNFVPSWQKHIDESGYLKSPGQTDYHQKAGYNFKENFPNTPGYVADTLGKAYQYGTEGIGSFFSDSTVPEAMARAKEESRLNSLGFRGQGFNMDEYNQTMDFARNGFNNTDTGLTYGAAQASELTDLERDFPGMSTGDIIDSMNNRGPAPAANDLSGLDLDRFAGVSNLGRNDMDVEQVEQLGSPSKFQGLQDKIGAGFNNVKDFAMDKGNMGRNLIGSAGAMAMGLPGIVGSGAMALMGGMGNMFEDRQLSGDGTTVDEYGRSYNASDLNKMNARGGYYTEAARSSRRRTNRINDMLARKAKGKRISAANLARLQAQEQAQEQARLTATTKYG